MRWCCCLAPKKSEEFEAVAVAPPLRPQGSGTHESSLSSGSELSEPLGKPREYADVNLFQQLDDFANLAIPFGTISDFQVYLNKSKIGEGAFGEVVLANQKGTNDDVAIKEIKADKANKAAFEAEVKILRHLQGGSNIVKLIDVVKDRSRGTYKLVFEYVNGCSTEDLLALPDADIRFYFFSLLNALHYTHSKGVIHRDVKFANVLFDPARRVLRLIDWGLADFYHAPTTRFPGTRYFKAPEMFLRYTGTDYSVDIWAFACMFGRIIFNTTNKYSVFQGQKPSAAEIEECARTQPNVQIATKICHEKKQIEAMAEVLGSGHFLRYVRRYTAVDPHCMPHAGLFIKLKAFEGYPWSEFPGADTVDDQAVDLIDRLLVWDHEKRLTAREALFHPYFNPVRVPEVSPMGEEPRKSSKRSKRSRRSRRQPSPDPTAGKEVAVANGEGDDNNPFAPDGWERPAMKPRDYPADDQPNNWIESIANLPIAFGTISDFQVYLDKTKIGEGAFGDVVLAKQKSSAQDVAIKKFKAEKSNRAAFEREVKILRHLQGGPNIVHLVDVVEDKSTSSYQLVFEFVEAATLSDLAALSAIDVKFYFFQLIRALHYTHSNGVVHKDVKFANVLFDVNRRIVRLIDWGLADFYTSKGSKSFPGTRYYKAPEMLVRYRYYDYSVDMWAVGCMLGRIILQRNKYSLFQHEQPVDPDDKEERNYLQMKCIVEVLGKSGLDAYIDRYTKVDKRCMADSHKFALLEPTEGCGLAALVSSATPLATEDAMDLLKCLLTYDHELRITAREALFHPYFNAVRIPMNEDGTSDHTESSEAGASNTQTQPNTYTEEVSRRGSYGYEDDETSSHTVDDMIYRNR